MTVTLGICASGCGGGGKSDEDAFSKALQAIETTVKPVLGPWTDGLANSASEQVQDSGTLDLRKVSSAAQGRAAEVTEKACEAIDAHKAIRKPPDSSHDGKEQLSEFVTLETVRSVGRFPRVVYASKASWPKSWLRDATSAPTYEADPKTIEPLFLKSILQDRFVGSDGAFLPPGPGTPDYPTLVSWLKQDSNSFDVVVFSLTDPLISGIGDCIDGSK
jgi:hypothetical protein